MIAGLILGIAVLALPFGAFETRRVLRDRAADRRARREALARVDCDPWGGLVHGDALYGSADRAAPGMSDDLSHRDGDREQGA